MTHYWRIKTRLPERQYQRCRVLARGKLNSCLVEFADGYRVIASRNSVRKQNGHYYNDNDRPTAAWLRDLVTADLIPAGKVDDRSITEVAAADVVRFRQCHWFAGIGGWPYALQLAGWPEDEPVWTASCPCQPFSTAGKRRGFDDERHLWPVFARLVAECRPPVVFGEQVASKDGRNWYARVRSDMEAMGYAVSAADLCAAGVGSPIRRQRLFWVAYAQGQRLRSSGPVQGESGRWQRETRRADARMAVGVGSANSEGPLTGLASIEDTRHGPAALADGDRSQAPWSEYHIVRDNKGKLRRTPVEPAFFPLADGLPGRVAQLRGLGNAIVPQLAAVFIEEALEAIRTLNP